VSTRWAAADRVVAQSVGEDQITGCFNIGSCCRSDLGDEFRLESVLKRPYSVAPVPRYFLEQVSPQLAAATAAGLDDVFSDVGNLVLQKNKRSVEKW